MCAAVHLLWVIRIIRRALKFMNPRSSLRVVDPRFAHVYASCLAPRSPDVNVERIKQVVLQNHKMQIKNATGIKGNDE